MVSDGGCPAALLGVGRGGWAAVDVRRVESDTGRDVLPSRWSCFRSGLSSNGDRRTATRRTRSPQSSAMPSMSEVSTTTGRCCRNAISATAASIAYLWLWRPAAISIAEAARASSSPTCTIRSPERIHRRRGRPGRPAGWRRVGEAADGADAVELARRPSPDVCLVDIRMPGLDGIGVTRAPCRDRRPGLGERPPGLPRTTPVQQTRLGRSFPSSRPRSQEARAASQGSAGQSPPHAPAHREPCQRTTSNTFFCKPLA